MTSTHAGTQPQPRRLHLVVVGAGISGLAAAFGLRRERPDAMVTVFDASPWIGGKLRREEVGGLTLDVGAEALLNRRPEAVALARAAGLGDDLVHPATTTANLWTRGQLRPMPRTLMGVPIDPASLVGTGLLSDEGTARAALDLTLPRTRLDDHDVSVGWLVEQRFGSEVVDRLVEPVLGGVYAGHARELSARATVPQVVALLERDSSLSRAAAATTGGTAASTPVFAGIRGGVGRLPEAVADASGADVRASSTVRAIEPTAHGWRLIVGSTHDPEIVKADAVILATPAAPTARLLADVAPAAARELVAIDYASMAVVTLVFRGSDLPQVHGSGFLVPPVDGRAIKAATYSFAKWGWVREAGQQGGEELLALRCSLGRHREERVLQVSDDELIHAARSDLADAIGAPAQLVDAHVQRWGGALPQYTVGHLGRIDRVRSAVSSVPRLAVCGAAYDGVGVAACVASAGAAVTQILAALPTAPQ